MTEVVTLPVGGMTCAACQSRVQRALQRAPGVQDATVNLILGTAAIRYDAGRTDPAQLVAAIQATGYEARLASTAESDLEAATARDRAQEQDYATVRRRAGWALLAGAVAMVGSVPLMTGPARGASVDPLMRAVMTQVAPLFERLAPWLFAVPRPMLSWGLLALTLGVVVGAGRHFYLRGWNAVRHGGADMNTLVALGTGAALIYSVVATVAPDVFVSHGLAPDAYDEAVVLIIAFVLTGNALEARATHRTAQALRSLAALQPATARIERDGVGTDVPIADVRRDDVVIVRPGERVAVDGVVIDGTSVVNESVLTGESKPVPKVAGDAVVGGSINDGGALRVRATTVGDASTLAGILRLLRDAQNSRAPVQQLADRISAVFVPVIVAIAIATAVAWIVLAPTAPVLRGFSAAVAVLIVACPCAMGLAVPTAVMVATGRAAELGILIRGGEALQRAGEVSTVIFDKTGTLTTGMPAVSDVVALGSASESELLAFAAAVESWSEHPLGAAITREAARRHLDIVASAEFASEGGLGARATVAGDEVLAGNRNYLVRHGVDVSAVDARPDLAANTGTVVLIARRGALAGAIILRDTMRPDAGAVVTRLRRGGMQVALLSGDRLEVARAIASQAGIDDVVADVLPAAKLAEIERRQQRGDIVAMVGDGVNDAPALARADVGIAMGSGAAVAVEAADIALSGNTLAQVADAIALSRRTMRIIRQNLFWAFGYNVIAVPIAAGVLYPATGVLLSPVLASAAMALSSVSVVLNSLRLRK